MTEAAVRDVVLLHGLWMPGVVMSPLAWRLRRDGFRTHVFAYAGRQRSLEAHADRLSRFARDAANGAPVHFVGHSMGGLIVLAALNAPNAPAAARVVLLVTPASGCMSARRLAVVSPGRWLLGDSLPLWLEGRVMRWNARAPLGVIAGGRPSFGLGRLLGALPGVNDGVVRIGETEIAGMAERVVLPVSHTELIFSSRVEAQTAHFLSHGHFKR
jgi:pimeloyl-ACP methyl ester carboxylesterase